jgi:hypothetical protein
MKVDSHLHLTRFASASALTVMFFLLPILAISFSSMGKIDAGTGVSALLNVAVLIAGSVTSQRTLMLVVLILNAL